MISRAALIAALVLVEGVIGGEMVLAVRSEVREPWPSTYAGAEFVSGSSLVEGGSHRTFDAGPHPALSVDIGYADLTILTGTASRFDASLSKSSTYGIFRAKAPITAHKDGDMIRLATSGRHWSTGDDRMVTVVVPPETRVTVENAGHIKANGLRAEASFRSVGNGKIAVEDYNAPALRVASSGGAVTLHRIVAGRLEVTSNDGRVSGTALQVRDGSVDSGDGQVRLDFAAGTDTLVAADTSNGRVRIVGFSAATAGDESSRTVRVGAGNGRLDVHSGDGDIYLSQAQPNDAPVAGSKM